MKYNHIIKAKFLNRPNRFIANVLIDGVEEIVHVKNTGRCKELLVPNTDVILEKSDNEKRKTKYSLISVYKGDTLINIDSQSPNTVVFEALKKGEIEELGKVTFAKREVTFCDSRFDIYFEKENQKGFIEIKGATLEENGVVMFPDAPTERGTKHIYEMIKAVQNGYVGIIFFLIQMKGVRYLTPNRKTDLKFSEALRFCKDYGVDVLAYDSVISENEIMIGEKVPILY